MTDDHGHDGHQVNYFLIFAALCVFTLISILADIVHLPYAVKVVAVLSVATSKALCVMAWFMHLKFERAWKYVLLAPTTILALGLPLALMPDIGERYYTNDIPQTDDYVEHQARSAHHATAQPESTEK